MSQPFKLRHQNEIVGALVVGSVFVVVAALLIVVQGRGWFSDYVSISATFEERNIGILKPGTKVRMRSNVIGKVAFSQITPERGLKVELQIEEEFIDNLTKDSEAILYLPIAGVGGPSFIEIRPGTSNDGLVEGQEIAARAAPDLLQLATDLLVEVKRDFGPALREVTELAERTNRILELFDGEMSSTDVASISAAVRETLARLDALLGSSLTTVDSVGELVATVSQGEGLIAKALNDAKLYEQLTQALRRMDTLTLQVESLVGKADNASDALPAIAANGAKALEDMVVVSRELKRLAPMLPTMISEVDQLLFESRAMMRAAQETWLIGDVLQNDIDLGLRMPSGLRDDTPPIEIAPGREDVPNPPRAERPDQ